MNDEAMKADDHAPDYRKAMLFHSDRADQYAAERDAAIARAEAAEAALAAAEAKVAKIVKAGIKIASIRSVWADPSNDDVRKEWNAAIRGNVVETYE